MNLDDYQTFTDVLIGNLTGDSRVEGVIALGSMAAQDVQPDCWSDHDFFVIVRPGQQESVRNELEWLPEAREVLYSYRETLHGVKAIYRSGHLLEFAVIDREELALAKVNRYRILLDKGDLAKKMGALQEATGRWVVETQEPDETLVGNFLTNLMVGAAHFHRGERLSGRKFIQCHALRNLVVLLARHRPSPVTSQLDDLDPFRRFEMVHPDLGLKLTEALVLPVPEAAASMLEIAADSLGDLFQKLPAGTVAVIRQTVTDR